MGSAAAKEHWSAFGGGGVNAIFIRSNEKLAKGNAMTPQCLHQDPRTELAARESHGISVKLLWTPETDLLTVTVSDSAYDDYFELVLDDADRPLDVFHHPYAHAAARGLDYRMHSREWEALADAA